MADHHRNLLIGTPEGVTFSVPLAGMAPRFLAFVVDAAAISAILSAVSKALLLLAAIDRDWLTVFTVISYFVVSVGYGMAFEWWWRGQTIGKRIFRLRVIDAQGYRLQAGQVALRNILRFVDALPVLYLAGGAACFLTQNSQRLGDLAAGTAVAYQPRLAPPEVLSILPTKFNSLSSYPHLVARLRRKTPADLAEVAQQALLRREQLEPQARVAIFEKLAAEFQGLVRFPEETTEQIAAEQYVRNVLGVLVRKETP